MKWKCDNSEKIINFLQNGGVKPQQKRSFWNEMLFVSQPR